MITTKSGYTTTARVLPAGAVVATSTADTPGQPSWGPRRRTGGTGATPAARTARTPKAAVPDRPASTADRAGDAAITLSLLAALLATPHDPTGAGTVAVPVQAALSGRLRRLLVAEDEGWHVALPDTARSGAAPCPAGPERADVAPALAAAVLAPAALSEGSAPDGWRLPELG